MGTDSICYKLPSTLLSASGELVWAELIIKYDSILIIPLDLFEFALREVMQTLFGVKNEK